MANCPFCKGTVEKELLVNGGTCPLCLIEIPGEEAATDPGVEAIARQREEVAAAKRRRTPLVAVAVLLAVVGVAGGGWYIAVGSQPQVIDLGEESFARIPLAAHQNVYQDEPEAEAAKGKSPASSAASSVASSGGSSGGSSSGSASSASASTPATGGQLASSSGSTGSPGRAGINPTAGSISKQVEEVDPTAALSTGSSIGGGPSVSVLSRTATEVLTDPTAIAEMTRRVVSRNSRQLEDCYSDRLKQDESIEGRWRVGFEIQKDGSVDKIEVAALTKADAPLETCLKDKVKRWRFQRISSAQGVSKNYSFTR